jgi:glucose/arabinose dehydrogenase
VGPKFRAPLAGVVALLGLLVALPQAGSAADGDLELLPIGTFSAPTYVAAPPGDGVRLFVVEQGGRIRLVRDGTLLPTDFLDLTTLVLSGGERGLFSIAFAPDYAASGRFYVYYTAREPEGELTIAEYVRSPNPDIAEPSGRIVLSVPHATYGNHNGGQLQFGPDGYLYIGTGDGGGGGDPDRNAQNLNSVLG